ncbi:unnamed protein product [[Actinomadura] parvosata subsp. kistnae]|nr:unnamed protein product [Actinomadura parvosata subsp. kistnae]
MVSVASLLTAVAALLAILWPAAGRWLGIAIALTDLIVALLALWQRR